MQKILTTMAISLSALIMTSLGTAVAAPPNDERDHKPMRMQNLSPEEMEARKEKRRLREEEGFKRLKQHKWQQGYVMPQHYRGDRYKVDYEQHQLPKPSRQQQWYKINNDYVLINSEDNSIVKIKSF